MKKCPECLFISRTKDDLGWHRVMHHSIYPGSDLKGTISRRGGILTGDQSPGNFDFIKKESGLPNPARRSVWH